MIPFLQALNCLDVPRRQTIFARVPFKGIEQNIGIKQKIMKNDDL
jgi:hypothetical protein